MNAKLKICMVGAAGAGKSSLVQRYVNSVFSERYETTIGVKILSRRTEHQGHTVDLLLWDLNGEDEFQSVQPAYLRGASGYVLVIDGTRPETADTALVLQARVRDAIGEKACVVLLNKADLVAEWEVGSTHAAQLERCGPVARTSARTGEGVDDAFSRLVGTILGHEASAWT